MKIGIITLYHNYNYGATLQAYALQTVIKRHWKDCSTINYYREINGKAKRPRPALIKSAINIYKSKKIDKSLGLSSLIKYQRQINKRNKMFDDFIRRNITESHKAYYGHKRIKELNNQYDLFVAGSDNIWNKNLLDSTFFLGFADDSKGKISYAAGMSYDKADVNVIDFIKPLLDRFDYISTREPTGKRLIEEITGKKVFQALDPTFLLTADEWECIEKPLDFYSNNGYILCFYIEPNEIMFHEAKLLKKETGKDIVCLPFLHQRVLPSETEYADTLLFDIGPEELLSVIRNADFVCTDSFHGTAFSVIFNKQFACFRRFQDKTRQSLNLRMDHVLNRFGISNRIVESKDEIMMLYSSSIEYDPINICIEKLRNESMKFLVGSIKSLEDREDYTFM